ncbi:hypothetical protein [Bowmanella denitrificans]|uniref:hypothetical protein n=1 Tax=Bowmanella denitrificans TaxID=366582 RepID=UPI000C9B559F|nr:hypothetical protein [Bowmanella denitrificans]
MNRNKKTEQPGRKAWLAGVGVYGQSREFSGEKLDKLVEGSTDLVDQLISRGEKVEQDLRSRWQTPAWLRQRMQVFKNTLAPGQDALSDATARLDSVLKELQSVVDAGLKAQEQQASPNDAQTTKAEAKPQENAAEAKSDSKDAASSSTATASGAKTATTETKAKPSSTNGPRTRRSTSNTASKSSS